MSSLTRRALICALLYPLSYFAIQLVAAPFYPGYSFLRNDASSLGSNQSTMPWVFNSGALINGVLGVIGAYGLGRTLSRPGVWRIVAIAAGIAVLLGALSSFWAGLFPLPDPRHAQNPLAVGLFAQPFVLTIALWPIAGSKLRAYLLGNVVLFAILAGCMSGAFQIDIRPIGGVLQRVLALVSFGPVAAAAARLMARAHFPSASYA